MFLQGNGVLELKGPSRVDDGRWHEVTTQFTPSYMEVSVDGEKRLLRPSLGENRHVDLSGLMYFGGVDSARVDRAREQGVKASGESLEVSVMHC